MTDTPPQPVPRLRHVRPGQAIRLQGVHRVLVLLNTDRRYGYFTDMKASLCHPVDREMMVFGDGGWRVNKPDLSTLPVDNRRDNHLASGQIPANSNTCDS